LQCNTYRFLGHHVGDVSRGYYRSKEEELEWSTLRDPLKILAGWLVGQNPASQTLIDRIELEVRDEIESGSNYALSAPYPDLEEVDKHVYV
jgi:pyruvate dehydrogenase E1 component alpha subunit